MSRSALNDAVGAKTQLTNAVVASFSSSSCSFSPGRSRISQKRFSQRSLSLPSRAFRYERNPPTVPHEQERVRHRDGVLTRGAHSRDALGRLRWRRPLVASRNFAGQSSIDTRTRSDSRIGPLRRSRRVSGGNDYSGCVRLPCRSRTVLCERRYGSDRSFERLATRDPTSNWSSSTSHRRRRSTSGPHRCWRNSRKNSTHAESTSVLQELNPRSCRCSKRWDWRRTLAA